VLTVGGRNLTAEGPNYTQAHVEPAEHGMKVGELVWRLAGTTRVGMATSDLNALVNSQAGVSVPADGLAFDDKPARPSMSLNVGVFALVGADQSRYPNFQWNVFSTPVLVAMLGIYESVRLESAVFEIDVDKGSGNELYCAITSAGVPISSQSGWAAAPVNTIIRGSDQGAVKGSFRLPVRSPFAREVRSRLPGNSPPTFHFGYVGAATTMAKVAGTIRVTCSGQAVVGFVNIGGDGGTKAGRRSQLKSMRRNVQAVIAGINYDVSVVAPRTDHEEPDSSDSSDDDDEAPPSTRTSPLRVGGGLPPRAPLR